jgi:insulysin
MEVFMQSFRQTLVDMPPEEFSANIDAVVQTLTEKKKNLSEEAYAHWRFIAEDTFDFHRLKTIAGMVKTVSKEDVLKLYDKFILTGSPVRRKLSIQIFGNGHLEKMNSAVPEGVKLVSSIDDFSRHVPLYPLPQDVDITQAMRL